tara:strand:+ start:731 stop:937 length:207 start_codon:yes stop_codon:yes gene_type:complete
MLERLTKEEVLMMDWAVYNEILRYVRQDPSTLSPRQQFKYKNLQSLRQKITNFVENSAKHAIVRENGQ